MCSDVTAGPGDSKLLKPYLGLRPVWPWPSSLMPTAAAGRWQCGPGSGLRQTQVEILPHALCVDCPLSVHARNVRGKLRRWRCCRAKQGDWALSTAPSREPLPATRRLVVFRPGSAG